MIDRSYGIIVSVAELDKARLFYRDTLGLGAPVVDSNHWIEFQLENGLVLVLRAQSKADKIKGCNVIWVFYTTDFDGTQNRLLKAGIEPLRISAPPVGLRSEVFADPEGNRFVLSEKPN